MLSTKNWVISITLILLVISILPQQIIAGEDTMKNKEDNNMVFVNHDVDVLIQMKNDGTLAKNLRLID